MSALLPLFSKTCLDNPIGEGYLLSQVNDEAQEQKRAAVTHVPQREAAKYLSIGVLPISIPFSSCNGEPATVCDSVFMERLNVRVDAAYVHRIGPKYSETSSLPWGGHGAAAISGGKCGVL